MRRWTMAALVVAALSGAAAQAPNAAAAAAAPGVSRDAALLRTVQYYGERRHRGDWETRHHWREHRRGHDEARVAEAARREAYRIQQERAYHRAARHAHRDRHGHYRGY